MSRHKAICFQDFIQLSGKAYRHLTALVFETNLSGAENASK
ncbi:hypothetical protein CES86_2635 [Brucella lupini]|uniref:Uncharacterized protein n=1 Tax=Brucella lupini TaxID=255457 RepID=A0A256GPE1_9HYPH|nr:hypothetical protein CES86_2635 [Brucella lupini]